MDLDPHLLNATTLRALIHEREDLMTGVQQLFAANNLDEDRAARDVLRAVWRRALKREGQAA